MPPTRRVLSLRRFLTPGDRDESRLTFHALSSSPTQREAVDVQRIVSLCIMNRRQQRYRHGVDCGGCVYPPIYAIKGVPEIDRTADPVSEFTQFF